jgi:hypothetical protein
MHEAELRLLYLRQDLSKNFKVILNLHDLVLKSRFLRLHDFRNLEKEYLQFRLAD